MTRWIVVLVLAWLIPAPAGAVLLRAEPAEATAEKSSDRDRAEASAGAERSKRSEGRERRRLANLTRQSVKLIRERKLEQAERALTQALELAPSNPTTLYNFACVKALQDEPE